MENQETNNKDNNQESGCTFFLKNGTTQFVPGASLKVLRDILNEDAGFIWLAYGNKLLIRVDQIVEVIDNNPEDREEEHED